MSVDSKMTAIADAIREKTGKTGTLTLDAMAQEISALNALGGVKISASQVNTTVAAFLANTSYDPSDYTTSQVEQYVNKQSNYREDWPNPIQTGFSTPAGEMVVPDSTGGILRKTVSAGSQTIYNLPPEADGADCIVRNGGSIVWCAHLSPTGTLRMIAADGVHNVRDLGGWACDGGTVKYGKLFRGSAPANASRKVLVEQCRVQSELDLRTSNETSQTGSAMGTDVDYTRTTTYPWYTLNDTSWSTILRKVFDDAVKGRALYIHCASGVDRTGTVCCILENLLGMAQGDIDKDYELSSFAVQNQGETFLRKRSYPDAGDHSSHQWRRLISEIGALEGDTMRDKVVTWVRALGFTTAEINAFRTAMIDGTPDRLVDPDVPIVNQIPISTDADGNVYNNGLGYKDGYRFNSSSAEATMTGTFITGFIPVKPGDVVRTLSGYLSKTFASAGSVRMVFYDSTKALIAGFTMGAFGGSGTPYPSYLADESGYITEFTIRKEFSNYSNWEDLSYIRMTMIGTGADAVVTVNQEIA